MFTVHCIGLTHGAVVTQPLGQRLVDARVRAPAAGEGGEQRQQAGGHGTALVLVLDFIYIFQHHSNSILKPRSNNSLRVWGLGRV